LAETIPFAKVSSTAKTVDKTRQKGISKTNKKKRLHISLPTPLLEKRGDMEDFIVLRLLSVIMQKICF